MTSDFESDINWPLGNIFFFYVNGIVASGQIDANNKAYVWYPIFHWYGNDNNHNIYKVSAIYYKNMDFTALSTLQTLSCYTSRAAGLVVLGIGKVNS